MRTTPKQRYQVIESLRGLGFSYGEASTLRRIAMTLSRWSELECGDEHGRAIERDEETGKPFLTYDSGSSGKRHRYPVADRETGALKRLAKIMKAYPKLTAYHQGDPRGASLYIVRKSDIPKLTRAEWDRMTCVDKSEAAFKRAKARQIDSYYTRGIAVY